MTTKCYTSATDFRLAKSSGTILGFYYLAQTELRNLNSTLPRRPSRRHPQGRLVESATTGESCPLQNLACFRTVRKLQNQKDILSKSKEIVEVALGSHPVFFFFFFFFSG